MLSHMDLHASGRTQPDTAGPVVHHYFKETDDEDGILANIVEEQNNGSLGHILPLVCVENGNLELLQACGIWGSSPRPMPRCALRGGHFHIVKAIAERMNACHGVTTKISLKLN